MIEDLKKSLEEIGYVDGKYLVSCFIQDGKWKIDFYSKEKHKIYTYEKIDGEWVSKEDDIFQEKKRVLEPLDLDRVKFGYEKAMEKVMDKGKAIIILQIIDGKILWNITVLTPEFKVLNIKVDAETGELIKETIDNLLQFGKDNLGVKPQ